MDKNKERLIVLKYPVRIIAKILVLIFIVIFLILFLKEKIIWNTDEFATGFFWVLCMVELYLLIYSLRNKTYFYVDENNNNFLMKNKEIISTETKKVFRMIDFYSARPNLNYTIYDSLLDFAILTFNKKKLKEKVKIITAYSRKYQIESIIKMYNFLNINIYKIKVNNQKAKKYILFNNF